MPNLIDEIRAARQHLREEEARTHDAAIEPQNCKRREKQAKGELDALLDELDTGKSPYLPGFDRLEIPGSEDGNGKGSPPSAGKQRSRRAGPAAGGKDTRDDGTRENPSI